MSMKFTFLFLNLAKIQIFFPKSVNGGGGPPVKELILKKDNFFSGCPNRFCEEKKYLKLQI